MTVESILALLAGTFYGLVIGIIPAAGATTGLVASFSFVPLFIGARYEAAPHAFDGGRARWCTGRESKGRNTARTAV